MSLSDVLVHIEKMLEIYSANEYYDKLKSAKVEYQKIAGVITEEDDEYESKMNLFNDWYLFQYLNTGYSSNYLTHYLKNNKVDPLISKSLMDVSYSLFQVQSLKKNKLKITDILANQKIELSEDNGHIGCVEGDLFIGRLLKHNKENYLLKGLCILPKGSESIIVKEAKKIRKLEDPNYEEKFLLKLESLKVKWLRYGHIEAEKIFNFS